MKEFKNSVLIQGEFSYKYLANLLDIADKCIDNIINCELISTDDTKHNKKKFLKIMKDIQKNYVLQKKAFYQIGFEKDDNDIICHDVIITSEDLKNE